MSSTCFYSFDSILIVSICYLPDQLFNYFICRPNEQKIGQIFWFLFTSHLKLNQKATKNVLIEICFFRFFFLRSLWWLLICRYLIWYMNNNLDTSTRKRQPKSDYGITWNRSSACVGVNTADVIHVGERNTRTMSTTSQM